MHFSTTVLFSLSLALAAGVFADTDAEASQLGRKTKPVKTSKRAVPSLLDRRQTCQGTCKTCFGPTYTDCPGGSIYCWDPTQGDSASQCSAQSSGGGSPSTPTSSAAESSATGGTTDTCYQKGADCVSCFGAGSVSCPSGSYYDCYKPAQYSQVDGCNKDGAGAPGASGSGAPAPSSTSSANQCEASYGAGNVLCGKDACYNPGRGACCSDGTHCPAGKECYLSGSTYKCRAGGPSGSPSSGSGITPTSSGILNTGTPVGVIGGGSTDPTSSASRITRSTSQSPSSTGSSSASTSTGVAASNGVAPALLGKDTGAYAAVGAGLLAFVGLL